MKDKQDILQGKFSATAVIFGADTSILDVKLHDGFSFVRKSLMPMADNLHEVFETDAWGLRLDYESARIDKSLDIICVTKCIEVNIPRSESNAIFRKLWEDNLASIDNQIRTIRFLVECPLRFKKIMFRLDFEHLIDYIDYSRHSLTCLVPLAESMTTPEISRFHCTKDKCELLGQKIMDIQFPLSNDYLNDGSLEIMKSIKLAIDPNNILNPGKVCE